MEGINGALDDNIADNFAPPAIFGIGHRNSPFIVTVGLEYEIGIEAVIEPADPFPDRRVLSTLSAFADP